MTQHSVHTYYLSPPMIMVDNNSLTDLHIILSGVYIDESTSSSIHAHWYEYVKNSIVTDDVISCDNIEHSSHALAEVLDGKHGNYWILVTRSSIGK